MASKRLTYRLLSAISEYKEGEKDMPDGLDGALDEVASKLHGHASAKPNTSDSGDEGDDKSSFESAGKKAAEKFRGDKDE